MMFQLSEALHTSISCENWETSEYFLLLSGDDVMQTFIDEQLLENSISDIYQPIKKQKLKTFTCLTNVNKVNIKKVESY